MPIVLKKKAYIHILNCENVESKFSSPIPLLTTATLPPFPSYSQYLLSTYHVPVSVLDVLQVIHMYKMN